MRDPYQVLGVGKTASEQDIKSAYRKLAKAFHPDQNKDDPTAHAKFAEATSAYDLLSDAGKRRAYDRGEIDANGQPKMGGFDFSGMHRGGARSGAGINPEDILKEFMGGLGGARASRGPQTSAGWDPFAGGPQGGQRKGRDFEAPILVSMEDAHKAATVPLRLTNGRVLQVKLPIGVQEGQVVRLRGQGQPSPTGGEAGDALIEVRFKRHKHFRRDGKDLRVDLLITLDEAVLGGRVRVPTLDGPVDITLKPGVDTSKAMRLKDKGLQGSGDLLVNLRIVLPREEDEGLSSLMRFWREQKPYSVRD